MTLNFGGADSQLAVGLQVPRAVGERPDCVSGNGAHISETHPPSDPHLSSYPLKYGKREIELGNHSRLW